MLKHQASEATTVAGGNRRKSTSPPTSNEKINLISAGIFALKNKSASSAVLAQTAGSTATMLGPVASVAMQSQSSTDLVLIEVVNNQNGLAASQATAMFAATSTDFDLIEVNETGFHHPNHPSSHHNNHHMSSNSNSTMPKMSIVGATMTNHSLSVSNNTSLIAKAGLAVLTAKKNGGSIKVKKSRAQKAMNVFKSQTSTSASNKEKKVTKTLAIVLIVFLVCW